MSWVSPTLYTFIINKRNINFLTIKKACSCSFEITLRCKTRDISQFHHGSMVMALLCSSVCVLVGGGYLSKKLTGCVDQRRKRPPTHPYIFPISDLLDSYLENFDEHICTIITISHYCSMIICVSITLFYRFICENYLSVHSANPRLTYIANIPGFTWLYSQTVPRLFSPKELNLVAYPLRVLSRLFVYCLVNTV